MTICDLCILKLLIISEEALSAILKASDSIVHSIPQPISSSLVDSPNELVYSLTQKVIY